ncbi:MAG: ribosome-associated translation inhibitor RaiA [Ulvibacter sp.]|jgi:ribosome-associated translation inhibitor RaiA
MKKLKQLFSKKRCTVTIGINGAAFTFHQGRLIEETILVKDLEEAKSSFKKIFQNRGNYPIYILLDNNDQIYKQKTYPAIRSLDASRLMKKDLSRGGPKTKNEVVSSIVKNKRLDKKWDALLFWVELEKDLVEWIDFLVFMPKNRLIGIYLLPIELKSSLLVIFKIALRDFNISKESNIDIITIDTKVSGLRQFIFYRNSLILSRDPDHNLGDDNFIRYFEQDMLRIIQYLKRSFPEVEVSNINFINILPKEFIKKVDSLRTKSLKIVNYEAGVISKKIGITTSKKDGSEILSDEILSSNFINSKKKFFRFSTARIKKINALYIVTSFLFFVNISVIIFLGYMAVKIFLNNSDRGHDKSNKELSQSNLELKLNKIRKKSLGTKNTQEKFYEIIDFGVIDNFFTNKEYLYLEGLGKTSFVPKDSNAIKIITYSLVNFRPNNIDTKYKVNISGSVLNNGGDIDTLFTNFDSLILSLKTSLTKEKLKYKDIPNNINFNKKFYKYPFDITIEPK